MELIKSLQIETLPEIFPNRMTAAEIVDDLQNTLNPDNFCVKGSELMQVLVGYAELAVEPVGWQALWRCDSRTKPELRNRLNSPAMVEVLHLDYENLEVTVEVQDNNKRSTENVALIELHPLRDQENDAVNIITTNNAIQKIRFFLHHLYYPWDADISENWFEVHLPVRVQMFCELRSGMLSQEIVARYHFLLTEAFEVERKLQQFAQKVPESEDEMDEESVENIANLNAKLEQIQQDVEILLNPSTRMLLFGSKVTRMKNNTRSQLLLVVEGRNTAGLFKVLHDIETVFGTEANITCYPSLQSALDDSRVDDVILIPEGIYSLLSISSLRLGGSLMGIGKRDDVVIHLGCNSEVGLAFDEGNVTIKNCTILVNNKQSGVSLKGNLCMENCVLRGVSRVDEPMGDEESAVASWKGVYVAPNSNLLMKKCIVSNFDVGLRVRVSGSVAAIESEVSACNIGVLVEEHSGINIDKCAVRDCKECAVVVEMEVENEEGRVQSGGPELLKLIPKTIQTSECLFSGNAADVKLEY